MSEDACKYFQNDQGCVESCSYYYLPADGTKVKRCVDKCSTFNSKNFFIADDNGNHCLGTACPQDSPYFVWNEDSTKCLDKCDDDHKYADQQTGKCTADCKTFKEIDGEKQKLFCVSACTKYYTVESMNSKKCLD